MAMLPDQHSNTHDDLLESGRESTVRSDMAERVRAFDWSKTPLGSASGWPQSLRTLVDMLLGQPLPVILLWGSELIQIYNDAYAVIAGSKHPAALGQPNRQCWPEALSLTEPIYERVLQRDESVLLTDQSIPLDRRGTGVLEEAYFTVSYGPCRNDVGRTRGIFVSVIETTAKVLAERERERWKAEAARREALVQVEQQAQVLDTALTHIDDFAYIFDREGRFLYANQPLLNMYGVTLEQVAGKNVYDLNYPAELADRIQSQIQQVVAQKQRLSGEAAYTNPSGVTRHYAHLFNPVLNAEGEVTVVTGSSRDITDRKRAEESIQASEERYRWLIETAHEGIWIIDSDGRTTYVNQRMADLLGYTFEEMLDRVHTDFMWEQDRPKGDLDMQLRRQGTAAVWDQRYRHKEGHEVWTVASCKTLVDKAGTFVGALGMFTDITARRRAEAELRANEERVRLATEVAELGIWVWHIDGDRVVWENDRMYEIFGVPRTAEPVNAARFKKDFVHPDDAAAFSEAISATTRSGERFFYQGRFRRGDGEQRWIEFTGTLKNVSDEYSRYVLGTAADITERKQDESVLRSSEERFRQLADAMPQMVWVTRPDGYHEYFNRRWYEFTGVPDGSTDGDGWNGMFHPEDQERVRNAWRQSLNTGEPYEVEYRLRHRSGNYLWTLGRALPVRNADGDITQWFGTCTDIDTLKRLQQERESLLERERAASRMKDEFLATLSHELRTPLNAILGWSQLLSRGVTDAQELAEGLRTIERNARAQTKIIEDLLDMSGIISGKVRIEMQRVDLASVIRESIATLKLSADAKGIEFQAILDPYAGPIRGDPARLHQVIWNLLANAVKFTPRGGRVQLLLERVQSHLEISVTDTGEGIRPEFLPFVFDRFRQADATITRRHGGLGLGLSIVKQLVELHGGSVRVTSAGLGLGTTFTLALPQAELLAMPTASVEPRVQDVATAIATPSQTTVQLSGVKVLVVDDETDARNLARRLLEERGATVVTAGSAAEAIELLRTAQPAVLVCDIGMPGEDGYSLMKRLRTLGPEDGSQIPSAALTAYARAEDRVKAIMAGFQMHLAKPIEPAELIATVASLAGRTGATL